MNEKLIFVIIGKLNGCTRDHLCDRLHKHSVLCDVTITESTDFILVGDKNTPGISIKLTKAIRMGIPILSAENIINLDDDGIGKYIYCLRALQGILKVNKIKT